MVKMLKQDVYYYYTRGRICVDLYSKALDILDGDNPDYWKYHILQEKGMPFHNAQLIGDTQLEVKGEHSPVCYLTPMTLHYVYFEFKLLHTSRGFQRPIMFEFTDQSGNTNRFPLKLAKGNNKVMVGQFVSTPGVQNVKAKMYDFGCQEKSGLLLHCMTIMPAED